MPPSPDPPNSPALPPAVAAYVEATNSSDLERLLTTFADNALVGTQWRTPRFMLLQHSWNPKSIGLVGTGTTAIRLH